MRRTTVSANAFNPAALFPRLLQFGISYGDLTRITAASQDWETWSRQVSALAEHYASMAAAACESGSRVSSAHFWRLASIYFHYSQLRVPLCDFKFHLRRRSVEAFVKFSAASRSPVKKFDIASEDTLLPGYWLGADRHAPLVILIGGLDSAKEVELYTFAKTFLQRGFQCYVFDGPGQGELLGRVALRLRFETVLHRVVDECLRHCSPAGLGVFGVSLGGFLAVRGAAADSRIQSCISIGGFFDTSTLAKLSPLGTEILQCSLRGPHSDRPVEVPVGLSVSDTCSNMAKPLFIIHGTQDHLVDDEQVRKFEAWSGGKAHVWRIEGAEHVCGDRFAECLPVIGDWMSGNIISDLTAVNAGS